MRVEQDRRKCRAGVATPGRGIRRRNRTCLNTSGSAKRAVRPSLAHKF